jgi:hypothetical protein
VNSVPKLGSSGSVCLKSYVHGRRVAPAWSKMAVGKLFRLVRQEGMGLATLSNVSNSTMDPPPSLPVTNIN